MSEKSLALIGNASGRTLECRGKTLLRGVFDKETRKKPLARQTLSYGI
jgi:hypothetical protein